MDPRIREHAEIVADWSTEISQGDDVLIHCQNGAEELARALVGEVAERGGQPLVTYKSGKAGREFLRRGNDKTIATEPAHARAATEAADKIIHLRAGTNTRESSDVDPEAQARRRKAVEDIREERLAKDWCLTMHPTESLAQEAGMSTEAFADLYYDAVLIDWAEFAEEIERVADRFNGSDEVRIVGEGTDLTMPTTERHFVASIGTNNLPSGEAFTAPILDGTDGEAYIDLPAVVEGREVQGIHLEFDDGEVVDYSAERGEEALASLLETDEGSDKLGELGIGMNRGIDRPTKNILLDEKMGGTIHLALGRAYKECNGEVESAVHQDFIKTMGEDSRIEVDGEVVQRDGTFWYEDGFEG
jgi:aminopeptidase